MLSLEGRQLGNYDVIRRIRSGGMGAVYEGRQRTAFDRRVAIKVILGNYAADPDMRRRFAREAKTIARLHHPHILQLIEFGDEQGVLYLVMPFIEGGTLTGYLRRHLPDVHEVSTIFHQLLDAVEHAHDEGLIHRDIKSSNVLLESRRSGPPYIYLADFGLVRTIQQADLESSYAGTPIPLDQVPGTPQYMAPEQTRGIVTTATDIYALGVLLYQLLTGELPYNDPDDIEVIKMHLHAPVPNPCELDASIPAELGGVVARAMAKRVEQRFANIAEFRAAFTAAIDGPGGHVGELSFANEEESEEDFEVHELPPRLSRPPHPQRASQQLRLPPPEPIEFGGQILPTPAVSPKRQRITGDQESHSLPPAGARRPRTTGEKGEASLPPAGARRQRVTGDDQEKALANSSTLALASKRAQTGKIAPVPRFASPARPTRPYKRQRRFSFAMFIGITVPVLLIVLLLMPRVFGLAIFPSGFPIFGAPPVATISLTVQTQSVEDNFLITASPNIQQADVNTRVMPARNVSDKASGSRTVATSGLQSSPGSQAHGTLNFSNNGFTSVSFSAGTAFMAANGVQVQLDVRVRIPSREGNTPGRANGPATAIQPGRSGNLPPGNFNSPSPFVTVANFTAFSGGSDTNVAHLITQNDLDNVKKELTPGLQQKALQAISGQVHDDEVQAGKPEYDIKVTSDHPVGTQAAQVVVTIIVTATALIYNSHVARDLAQQLLIRKAAQAPGTHYQLRGSPDITEPTVAQQDTDKRLYLNIHASGLWAYGVTASEENLWRQAIQGASVTLAQNYLNTRPGITSAQIQLPFNTTTLPTGGDQIVFIVVQQ